MLHQWKFSFNFIETSQNSYNVLYSYKQYMNFPKVLHTHCTWYYPSLYFSHLGGYVLVSLSGFYLNFFHGFMILSILPHVGFFCLFFTLVSISLNLLPILLLLIFLKGSLYILILRPFSDIYGTYFLILWLVFFFYFPNSFSKKQNILNLVQSNNHFFPYFPLWIMLSCVPIKAFFAFVRIINTFFLFSSRNFIVLASV